jgi:hypothetical protein
MLHLHELSTAVQVDREREIQERLPRLRGLSSGRRHPAQPDSGVVEPGRRGMELRREPRVAFGS